MVIAIFTLLSFSLRHSGFSGSSGFRGVGYRILGSIFGMRRMGLMIFVGLEFEFREIH